MPTPTNQIPTTPTDAAFPRTPEAHHRAGVGKAVGTVQGEKGDQVCQSIPPALAPSCAAASVPCGSVAWDVFGVRLPLCVVHTAHSYRVGTQLDHVTLSVESVEGWPTYQLAIAALRDGLWTQRRLAPAVLSLGPDFLDSDVPY